MSRDLVDRDTLAALIVDVMLDRLRGVDGAMLADQIAARLAERERTALLDVDELAAKLNLTVGALEKRLQRDVALSALTIRLGRTRRWRASDVDALLACRRRGQSMEAE